MAVVVVVFNIFFAMLLVFAANGCVVVSEKNNALEPHQSEMRQYGCESETKAYQAETTNRRQLLYYHCYKFWINHNFPEEDDELLKQMVTKESNKI